MAEKTAVAFTETQEFKDAVSKAAAEAAAQAVAEVQRTLLSSVKDGAQPAGGDDLVSRLALAIAEISDQGTSRKRVAPEILAQRAAAHLRAVELLKPLHERDYAGPLPEYELVSKVYLNERFIEPFIMGLDKRPVRTVIVWSGMPNEAMRPKNEIASRIYAEFRASIGSTEKINGVGNKPLWMTPKGLVIKGDAPQTAQQKTLLPNDVEGSPFADNLGVKNDPRDPTAPFINVLGTVAPPARQNYQDQGRAA